MNFKIDPGSLIRNKNIEYTFKELVNFYLKSYQNVK